MSKPQGGGGNRASPFFEIKDPILIAKIFDLATRHHVPLTLWLKSQTLKFETELTGDVRKYKTCTALLPSEISAETFNKQLEEQKTFDLLGSMIIDATSFFFRTTVQPIGEDRKYVRFTVPTSIFKLQRRANLRIPFQRHLAPKVTVFDPTKEFKPGKALLDADLLPLRMLDLSAGGCALAARIEDKDKFKAETLLHDVRFLVRTMEIVTEAVIRHTFETTNDRGKPMLRVGLQFKNLRSDFEKYIVQFVLDESRKIFTLLQ